MKSYITFILSILMLSAKSSSLCGAEVILDPRHVDVSLDVPLSRSADLDRASILVRTDGEIIMRIPFSELKSTAGFSYEIDKAAHLRVYFEEREANSNIVIKTLMGDQKFNGVWFDPVPLCSLMNESRQCFAQLSRDDVSKSFSIQILKK